ncbi:hypothetical protein [Streptosporangium roseum]|nr:hypothetical protein [Streptosporangium roseum]
MARTLTGHDDRVVFSVTATPDGRHVIGGVDGTVRVWNLTTDQR